MSVEVNTFNILDYQNSFPLEDDDCRVSLITFHWFHFAYLNEKILFYMQESKTL
jgi:hypothetical protein